MSPEVGGGSAKARSALYAYRNGRNGERRGYGAQVGAVRKSREANVRCRSGTACETLWCVVACQLVAIAHGTTGTARVIGAAVVGGWGGRENG